MEALRIQSPYMSGTELDLISLNDEEENQSSENESDNEEVVFIRGKGHERPLSVITPFTPQTYNNGEGDDSRTYSRLNIEGLSYTWG